MIKREAELKSAFTAVQGRELPRYIVLYHLTAGAPDRSITGAGKTTHWEFKHGTPGFKSPGNQELLCMRLAMQGYCRYVIWQEYHGIERTLIVHPSHIPNTNRLGEIFHIEAECVGFNHHWLCEQIRQVHQS